MPEGVTRLVTYASTEITNVANASRYQFGQSAGVSTTLNTEEIRRRIRALLDERNVSQVELAARLDTTPATISRLLNDKRGLSLEWIRRIAAELDASPAALINDVTAEQGATVPVVGYVGAGEQVFNFDDNQIDRVPAPDRPGAEESSAVIVRGESMWPKYEDGQLLFFMPSDHVSKDCVGRICVVQVKDGPTLVKRVREGKNGRYRLVSLRAPEMEDIDLAWAARVRWTEEP